MNMKKTLLASMLALSCFGTAFAAEIVPVNADPANQGLNDPTPLAPAGGNPGTTIGEQRRIVYQYAADMWGAVIESPAQIRVQASFAPLQCIPTRQVLGSARTNPIYILSGDGLPETLFHGALADALIGEDLDAGTPNAGRVDIISQFNSSWGKTNPDGTPCGGAGSGWYYGLDGNTPAGLTSFLDTVMHEIAHGLGFSGFGDVNTGAPLAGYPDIYSLFVHDNVSNNDWYAMTNAGRRAALVGNNLVFQGPNVTAEVPLVLDDKIALRMSGALTANYDFGTAAFGPTATPANFSGALALANDGAGPDTADACEPLPAGSLTGKIAFVNRGGPPAPAPTCGFELKAVNAQNAGAIAVIVGNVATSANPNTPLSMADDPTLTATIPALHLILNDANAVRTALAGGAVNASLGTVPGLLAGADAAGYARLYAPATLTPGSTFSHYDVTMTPNALMEPAINDSLAANAYLDLTPALFADEGWTLNPGNGTIGDCDTGVDAIGPGGLAIGAGIQAYARVCLNNAGGSRANYLRCVTDQATKLKNAGLINTTQFGKVRTCASKVTP